VLELGHKKEITAEATADEPKIVKKPTLAVDFINECPEDVSEHI
jgi:hypothetical protein